VPRRFRQQQTNSGGPRHEQLLAQGISVQFEGVRALDGVDLTLQRGQILGLIGPNGAGKTTLINVLSGFQRPTLGRVCIDSADITRHAAHRRVRRGVARTFQSVRLFADLTVAQNVEAAAAVATRRKASAIESARALLSALQLEDQAHHLASSLPYGAERRLGIARALATRPSFLLLDEPAAGLNEHESDELHEAIVRIRERFGCGILLIEHNMRLIMKLCDHIQVLDYGKTISHGTPEYIQADPAVRTAYLGTDGAQPC
jgi:branched-chain amino acid transport system ATP-binding protein